MPRLPPLHPLTDEDRGPIVIVAAYICIVETLLFTIIKLVSNNWLKRKLDWDDGLLFAAAILALAQSVTTERSAINGVGSYEASLTHSQLEQYFKVGQRALFPRPVLTPPACPRVQHPIADSAGACKVLSGRPSATAERIAYSQKYTPSHPWNNPSMACLQYICPMFSVQAATVVGLRPISVYW